MHGFTAGNRYPPQTTHPWLQQQSESPQDPQEAFVAVLSPVFFSCAVFLVLWSLLYYFNEFCVFVR